MLEYLLEYADHKGLAPEPGFKSKTIKFALDFTADGTFLGVLSLGEDGKGRVLRCPDLSQPEMLALKGGCHFLTEAAINVALLMKDNTAEKEFAKANEKHAYFVGLLNQAASVIPSLAAVARALQSQDALAEIQEQLRESKAKETDAVSLRVEGELVLEDRRWYPWWRDFRGRLPHKTTGNDMVCFATGTVSVPAATHPKVSASTIGGQSSGSTLVSFDKDSFGSFGLKQSANAAVCEAASTAYRDAINHLIANSPTVAGSKPLYWYDCEVADDEDVLSFLLEPASLKEATALQAARALLTAIRSGETPNSSQLAASKYYCCTVTGAAGRVMVRDWMTGQFEQLAVAVASWFEDLAIVGNDGRSLAREPAIGRVVESLLPVRRTAQNYDDWVKPVKSMLPQVWRAALNPQMGIPYRAMAAVVTQHRAYVQTQGSAPFTLENRMAVLKAYLLRSSRLKGEKIIMTAFLEPNHPSAAYQCGRLLAVLAALQQRALGTLNAGVIERYYGSASATPALVLGRLTRTSQFHLNKLDSGLARWYDGRIAEIWAAIQHDVPRTLGMEEQSLFALGYYHQKAADAAALTEKRNAPQTDATSGQ